MKTICSQFTNDESKAQIVKGHGPRQYYLMRTDVEPGPKSPNSQPSEPSTEQGLSSRAVDRNHTSSKVPTIGWSLSGKAHPHIFTHTHILIS